MEDTLSPTQTFLNFDFSEFIDKNFDMSSDLLNSPNIKLLSPSIISSSDADNFLAENDTSAVATTQPSVAAAATVTGTANYTHDDSEMLLNSLWSSIEELAAATESCKPVTSGSSAEVETASLPPTLSYIDEFIRDPQADLSQLIGLTDNNEHSIFQNLIVQSLQEYMPVTPQQILQQQQINEQQQRLIHQQRMFQIQQQQQQQQYHQRVSDQQPIYQFQQQQQQQQIPQLLLQQRLQHDQLQHPQRPQTLPQPPLPPSTQQRKRKSTSAIGQSSSQANKKTNRSNSYSSSSTYTHSDSVNAQLLKELIRQAGKNNPNNTMRPQSPSSFSKNDLMFPADFRMTSQPMHYQNNNSKEQQYYMPPAAVNGSYHPYQQQRYYHHPYPPASNNTEAMLSPSLSSTTSTASTTTNSHSSRYYANLPYHIQTNPLPKKNGSSTKQYNVKNGNSSMRTTLNTTSNKSAGMGSKPSMYSSDISQAQLLKIQAISRAQQDFIRAREQQEAEKEIVMKRQKKTTTTQS